jgi:transaldolase
MKLFIDTAELDEIEKAYDLGILDGVTTNPSLMNAVVEDLRMQGKKIDLDNYIKQILKIARGTPVSLEVTRMDCEGMVEEGKALYKKFNSVARNVIIKIPVNTSFDGMGNSFDGIKAIRALSKAKIPVNCTLIFTPEQALMAAKAGAKFVSPFAGRIDDLLRVREGIKFEKADYFPAHGYSKHGLVKHGILNDNGIISGVDLVMKCVEIFENYDLKCEILAASIRNTRQFREVALAGSDIATVPFKVIKDLLGHEMTQKGMRKFMNDIVPEYVALSQKKRGKDEI